MLTKFFPDPITLAAVQAVVAGLLALLVAFLAWWMHLHMEKEIIIALGRGLLQVIAVGAILLFIF